MDGPTAFVCLADAKGVAGMGIVDKSELISAILALNHSAKVEFLQKFSESDLKAYLERIRSSAVVICAPWIVAPPSRPCYR
jgi:hypothetical protein